MRNTKDSFSPAWGEGGPCLPAGRDEGRPQDGATALDPNPQPAGVWRVRELLGCRSFDQFLELRHLLPDPTGRGAALRIFHQHNLGNGKNTLSALVEGVIKALQFLE